ncbi:MAG: sigma-54 dependent transcriptional regulator [Acidobacteriia bacterium]|nr:sigma-54 dependent transcriptional regulator [Terriglobia bacterium]
MEPESNGGKANLLVVDDDAETRNLLSEFLGEAGYRVVTSGSGEEALEIGQQELFDVIISDMRLGPSLNGLDVLRAYKSIQPESEVILITAFGSMETAIEAVKAGAFDYLSKPFKIDEVLLQVERALENRKLVRENMNLKRQLGSQGQLSSLVGRSPKMLEIYKKIAMVADSPSTVMIYGESGTGKELVARAIHGNGPRAEKRFYPVNCGALTETLLETELFGHVRGSFTGAVENKRGIFEDASGGTVFLDEVSEMSPALQVKVLRVLEEQEIRRIGSNQPVKVDVRIIAASNRNLAELVEANKFRQDLYYRLRVIEIELPPLRERLEDIPLLVEHFLKKLGRERNRHIGISTVALSTLMVYTWPGNVRELENALESAGALNRTGLIHPEELPAKVREESQHPSRLEDLFETLPTLEELEKRYMQHVLKVTHGNKAAAAAILEINRRTLYRKLEGGKPPDGQR